MNGEGGRAGSQAGGSSGDAGSSGSGLAEDATSGPRLLPDAGDGGAEVEAPCETPKNIADEASFRAEVQALDAQVVSVALSRVLTASRTLRATEDLELSPEGYPPLPSSYEHSSCGDAGVCWDTLFHLNAFPRSPRVDGVTCTDWRSWDEDDREDCHAVEIAAGTEFRIRWIIQDTHPRPYISRIEFLPACDVPCAADERRCAATQTCLPSDETCALCEGASRPDCACRDGAARLPNGAECTYADAPDFDVVGVCDDGTCFWE